MARMVSIALLHIPEPTTNMKKKKKASPSVRSYAFEKNVRNRPYRIESTSDFHLANNWRAGSNNRGWAGKTRVSIVQTVEVRLNFFFVKSRDKKYSDVEDIKTHIFCWIKIFIQSTVLEKKIIYWLLWVSENPYHYKLNSRYFHNKKSKWF